MLIGAGEIIKRSWRLYTGNFNTMVKFALLALLPAAIAFAFSLGAISGALLFSAGRAATFIFMILLGIALLIAIIWVAAWVNFSMIRAIAALYRNQAVTRVKEVLMGTKPVVWRSIGASIVASLLPVLPLMLVLFLYAVSTFVMSSGAAGYGAARPLQILLGLAGTASVFFAIYYAIKLFFTMYGTILDNETIGAAVNRSKSLVSGRWWGVFWRLLAPSFVFGVAIFIVSMLLSTLGQNVGGVGQALFEIVRLAISLIYTPLPAAAIVILYQELIATPVSATPAQPTSV